jgi:hypothetical protein
MGVSIAARELKYGSKYVKINNGKTAYLPHIFASPEIGNY